MTLANGRPLLAIPGPSVIPDRVLAAMHRPAPNIYEGELIEMTDTVLRDLRRVARTEGEVCIYIGNGHAAWEAALANTLAPGDRALVLATGRFGKGWAEMAKTRGIDVDLLDFGTERPVDPAEVEARLKADKGGKVRAVLTVHTDTATSVRNDIAAIRAAIDAAGHEALFMVDCIADLACERFEMDAWGVDVTVSASQKGLMTPPGLGLVFFGARARAARARLGAVSSYWDWVPRTEGGVYYQKFCGTAPTHHIFGLREALTMLLEEEGLEAVWQRHRHLAEAVWTAVGHWAAGGPLRCNVPDRLHRSTAVTAVLTGEADAEALRRWCADRAGLTLGVGLGLSGPTKGSRTPGLFRIGHMGHLNPPMLLGTLATIEAGMKALGIPHGDGALSGAAAVIAKA
ncbi:MAG: aminotransferase class V-fold PLP-dependent enzyme [Pseudomonadota bacterium]